MKVEQLITMLQLQDRLNSRVNPDWRNAGNDWSLAIMLECGELIDHVGWKWWKKQDMNLPQAQIELVDIWHFFLSREIEHADDVGMDFDELAEVIIDEMQEKATSGAAASTFIIESARSLAKHAAAGNEIPLWTISTLCRRLGLSYDDLFRMYVGKAALNLFRYENGYQDGSYIKTWMGREDNVWLEEILASGVTDLDTILGLLAERYEDVKLVAGRT